MDIIKKTTATKNDPLKYVNLEASHLGDLKNVTYGTVPIQNIFDEPMQVLATFEAKSVIRVKGNVYIYESGKTAGPTLFMIEIAKITNKSLNWFLSKI